MTTGERLELRRLDRSMRILALQDFAVNHPHECHEKWPWRFWIVFHRMIPHVSRDQMRQTLKETE